MIELQSIHPHSINLANNTVPSEIWACKLSFKQGKNYLIQAASGKGKSTLLHIIYGLRKDYEGSIFLQLKNIRELTPDYWSDLRQNKLSIVFQDLRLFPNLTAWENLKIKSNLSTSISDEWLKYAANQLGVSTLLKKPCDTLSYGQKQRIAIIRALAQPFEYLLLDEPFSHLDEANVKIACHLIQTRCKELNAGFILVSLGEKYFFQYDKELQL